MTSPTDRKCKWKGVSLTRPEETRQKCFLDGLTWNRSGKQKKLEVSVCLWYLRTRDFMALREMSQPLGCANVQLSLPPGRHFSDMYKVDSFSRRNWYLALSKTLTYLGNNFLDILLRWWPLGCCLTQWNQFHFFLSASVFPKRVPQVGKAQTELEVVAWILDGWAWPSTRGNVDHTCRVEAEKLGYSSCGDGASKLHSS